jgi:hypothetical protein
MLLRNRLFHFLAALAFGLTCGVMTSAHAAPAPAAPELEAAVKAMGMTPEKRQAMEAAMKQHMAGMEPEMEAMGKTMTKSLDTPEMRASMDKVAKEMTGVMASQVPVMMQAMQPMLADMLPRMLRMQADMLQILFATPTPETK